LYARRVEEEERRDAVLIANPVQTNGFSGVKKGFFLNGVDGGYPL